MTRVASCSADISSEKKPTMPPLIVLCEPSGSSFELIGLGDVEGDVGGERGLAHAGTPGDDDEIGLLQAAHLLVEIEQARGDAGEMPVAHDRRCSPCRSRWSSASAKRWKPPS